MRRMAVSSLLALLGAFVLQQQVLAQPFADPLRLPPASRQTPDWAAYQALGIWNAVAGTPSATYFDPATGVRVTKVTSATVPLANPWVSVDYSEGGPYVSGEWGVGQHTILVRPAGAALPWLVEYKRGVGISNWRPFPGTMAPRFGQTSSFSNVPTTPHILYFVDWSGGDLLQNMKLYRFNTLTDMLEGDGGYVPASGREIPGTAGSPGTTHTRLAWMQSSKDDRWFVFQWCVIDSTTNTDTCFAKKVLALDRLSPNGPNNPLWRECNAGEFNCLDRRGERDPVTGQYGPPDGLWDGSDLDEPHLDRDGNYVILLDGTRDALLSDPEPDLPPACGGGANDRVFYERYWHLWDLNTNLLTCKADIYAAHTGWVRGHFPGQDGDETLARNFYYSAATGALTHTAQYDSLLSLQVSHRAGQWIQSATDATQWYWGSNYDDGEARSNVGPIDPACPGQTGGWLPHSGQIYKTGIDWNSVYLKPDIGIRAVYQTMNEPWNPSVCSGHNCLSYTLQPAPSPGAVTEGTFFYDNRGTACDEDDLLYVWAIGGGDPTGRVYFFAPTAVHRGVGVGRLDGTDLRLLCHNYSWPNDYEEIPFANASPDGKVVLFNSNMGQRNGRPDVFIAEVPLSTSAGAEVTLKGSICGGSYPSTHTSNNAYECLREGLINGKAKLTHKWTFFNVPPGSQYLTFEGYGPDPPEFGSTDSFQFYFNTTGQDFGQTITGAIIPDNSETSATVSLNLVTTAPTNITIIVADVNPDQASDTQVNHVFIDHLKILTED